MPRCVGCGQDIDDEQASRFNGYCPNCVRARANPDRKDDLAFESGIWALVMFFGILVIVGSIGFAVLFLRFALGTGGQFLAFIVGGAIVGVIVGYAMYYIGHQQHLKAKAKLDAATYGQNASTQR